MSTIVVRALITAAIAFCIATPSHAANVTRAEFNALVSVVRVITLGGPTQDYIGALILTKTGVTNGNAIGTGRGIAIISGSVKNFAGTWAIKGNKFCRKWNNFDGGKEICETWTYLTQSSVSVVVGSTIYGVNSW